MVERDLTKLKTLVAKRFQQIGHLRVLGWPHGWQAGGERPGALEPVQGGAGPAAGDRITQAHRGELGAEPHDRGLQLEAPEPGLMTLQVGESQPDVHDMAVPVPLGKGELGPGRPQQQPRPQGVATGRAQRWLRYLARVRDVADREQCSCDVQAESARLLSQADGRELSRKLLDVGRQA